MITLSVEDRHIHTGIRRNRFGNPIALAVADQISRLFQILPWNTCTGFWIEVDADTVVWETQDTVYEFFLPPEARDFIRKFDAGNPVSPLRFELTR